jgi:ABC-type dipeptide/oligopeptide/nickel transport system permease subunit
MAMIQMPSGSAEPGAGPEPLELAELTAAEQRAGHSRSPAIRAVARMGKAIRSNRKATWGAGILLVIVLVSVFPGLIAHDDPNAIGAYKSGLGPSLHHLLGTTGLGADMFSQIIFGARPVLEIAFGVGVGATAIAVLIGVAAACSRC